MRLVLIGVVTLVLGGAVVGYVLFKNSRPEGIPTAAGHRPLADFLAQEHLAAVGGGSSQFTATTPEEFKIHTGVWLGRQMEFEETLFAEGSGVQFVGGRESSVPGPGRSAHMLLALEDGSKVSLFLQQYRAIPELQRNTGYTLPAAALGSGAPPIVVYLPGGQIHYLVATTADGLATLRRALSIPEPSKAY